MAQEIKVGEDRYLVGGNMGKERSYLNGNPVDMLHHMSDILSIAGNNVSRLTNRHSEVVGLDFRSRGPIERFWSTLEIEYTKQLGDAIENLTAAAVDIAWLRGGMPLVERVLGRRS